MLTPVAFGNRRWRAPCGPTSGQIAPRFHREDFCPCRPTSGGKGDGDIQDIERERRTRTATIDDPDMPLLYALRDDLALHGPRFGCGLGQCGACTVHIDGGRCARAYCRSPGSAPRKIVTLEGLGTTENPHPVQRAFIEEQAAQCGYCINGMIMQSAAFLARTGSRPKRTSRRAGQQSLPLRNASPHRRGRHARR